MHNDQPSPRTAGTLGNVLISSRSLAEYRAMFSLTDEDLRKNILDCPGGAASFTGQVHELGGRVTACDSAYFDHTPADLARIAVAEAARGNRFVRTQHEQYEWTFFTDPSDHERARTQAAQDFSSHIGLYPERFVAGRLPSLPFADATFDLVLSSHLLFSYSDIFSHEFHVASITELMRVARTELRIFPLVAVDATTPYPRLNELLGELAQSGIVSRIVNVDYRFQRGAHEMLVCTRSNPQQ